MFWSGWIAKRGSILARSRGASPAMAVSVIQLGAHRSVIGFTCRVCFVECLQDYKDTINEKRMIGFQKLSKCFAEDSRSEKSKAKL